MVKLDRELQTGVIIYIFISYLIGSPSPKKGVVQGQLSFRTLTARGGWAVISTRW